jgi:dihydrofolate synthase/folylpolyglutamate synthase
MSSKDLSSLEEWIDLHLGKEVFEPGLERIKSLIDPLVVQLKKKKTKFITIGGTNGKGQTSYMLAHLLKSHGHSYTLWTSPHILEITERISSEKGNVEASWLLNKCEEFSFLSKKLSYFEFLFYLFLKFSCEKEPDFIILEVGLGGRLDAVNSIDADLMAITSISRDHEEILGKGYQKILQEKWGITRSNKPLFTAFDLQYLSQLAYHWSHRDKVDWIDLMKLGVIQKKDDFFIRNQLMAWALYRRLFEEAVSRIDLDSIHFPLMPHRGDKLSYRDGKLQFIGSHNTDGMRKLLYYFCARKNEDFDYVLVSFSKRSEREIEAMLKSLKSLPKIFKNILVTKFDHPKAWNGNVTNLISPHLKEVIWEDFLLNENLGSKNILVTGSYYFVGEVKKFILRNSA